VGFALSTGTAFAAPPIEENNGMNYRMGVISELMTTWQGRTGFENLSADEKKSWSRTYSAKFSRLSDAQLALARQANSLDELDLLFVASPISDGARFDSITGDLPNGIRVVPPKGTNLSKSNPVTSPALYNDLVFTAVQPCRIYDSRFSTAPINGTPGAVWPANTVRTLSVGPEVSYAFQGGQAVNCTGTLATGGTIAAAMTAVSTVNQSGAGYLVFYSSGGTNPNPYGVAQWFQPGYVQTSFVVMPTDMISDVFSNGFIGNASSHVIVDLVGYFAKSKSNVWAVIDGAAGTISRGYLATGATRLGPGLYEVIFASDVTSCAYTASLGDLGAGSAPSGEISLASRSGNANGVFVATYNSAGTLTDRNFHLKVKC
jgi:hypothetical protein